MAAITVRNASNFEPDVGLPTLLAPGAQAKVERTDQIDDYIEAGVLVDVAAEKKADTAKEGQK